MTKISITALILIVCLLTSCSPPNTDYVVINKSDVVLEVEYEFFGASPVESNKPFPAKQELAKYELENDSHKNDWRSVTNDEYEIEKDQRERIVRYSQDKKREVVETTKIKLKLLPGEVLQVTEAQFSFDESKLCRLSLKGERGNIIYENGRLLERFDSYYRKSWLPQMDPFDYRIVYQ